MATRSDITPELCRQLLRYEPETGKLFWLPRDRELFATYLAYVAWAKKHVGQEAFTSVVKSKAGVFYRKGTIWNVQFWAHRVVWAIVHGAWPDVIDHIDGDGTNNRISNLRSVTNEENMTNAKSKTNNTSGVHGVSFHDGRWRYRIKHKGKSYEKSGFDTIDAARDAAQKVRAALGFDPTHGRTK